MTKMWVKGQIFERDRRGGGSSSSGGGDASGNINTKDIITGSGSE